MSHFLTQIVLLPVFLISMLFPLLVNAATMSLELTDGRWCFDKNTDGDGLFNNGCGGPNYVFYADNRTEPDPGGGSTFPRRIRTSLEYDISSVLGASVSSAILRLYFSHARDLTQLGTPPPESELLGYVGDGTVRSSDMLSTNLLSSFSPSPSSFFDLNVTDFIQSLVLDGDQYAGFTFRIKDDFLSDVFSEAYFSGEVFPGANSDPSKTPKLIINTAPPPPALVTIDIKPGSDPNCFNINGHGIIPVAILGSGDFDVSQIDLTSLSFGGLEIRVRGNKGPLCSFEYSNDDDYLDLVCHFEDDADAWVTGDGEATLTGNLLDDGSSFEGTDLICVVP